MNEAMNKALHNAGFLVDDLSECLQDATGAERIVLRTLLGRAADIEQDIKNLKAAMEKAE